MVKLQYLGHSAFLVSDDTSRLIIDPFLTGNPKASMKASDVKVDYVLVTHGHMDHLGDAIAIAKRTGATLIANSEVAQYCATQGVKIHEMNLGGSAKFPFGSVKLTIAHHTGVIEGEQGPVASGACNGFLITMEHQVRIYHAGDTALTYDMKLLGEMFDIDVALLPIGDNFTMGIDDAVKAVEFLNPDVAIPMHYGTFKAIQADPQEFASKVFATGKAVKILTPGEEFLVEDKVGKIQKGSR